MDATSTVAQPYKSLLPPPRLNRRMTMHNPRRSNFIRSVLADKNLDAHDQSKTSYTDNWFDRLAINHLSQSLQSSAGMRSSKGGYEGLVEAATMASRKFNPNQQRQVVIQTLQTAIPPPILFMIKKLLPPSKFAREYFAVFTTIFFAWLVGPCQNQEEVLRSEFLVQVKESETEGRREKNVVYVPKCRFLEETNCVGMCTNLCKMPSQSFIKDSLGMPFTMVPNFEDMSCEMIFGEEPPPQSLDPAFAQPCYKQCNSKQRHQDNCAS